VRSATSYTPPLFAMVNHNAETAKTGNGTNATANLIVKADGNATQPKAMTSSAARMNDALSASLADLSEQENGTTGECENPP